MGGGPTSAASIRAVGFGQYVLPGAPRVARGPFDDEYAVIGPPRKDDTEINWTDVGITSLVSFVAPILPLLRGGEAPLYAFGAMLVAGTFNLVFERE